MQNYEHDLSNKTKISLKVAALSTKNKRYLTNSHQRNLILT